ncbi:type III pantothenate kinase [Phycisphaerales bacterium]|nr:type III pantothenate kinase [Phycisphaerales bacterium]
MPEELLIAVAVGNTRTRWGLMRGRELDESAAAPNDDLAAIVSGILKVGEAIHEAPIVIASVNPAVSDGLASRLEDAGGGRVLRIGEDIAIPLKHDLDDATTLGQDRALCALAAFKRAGQACVVVDAGTAVTVDFIDGEGVFQGGVIAPGAAMMLRALSEQTAALPPLKFEPPDPSRGPFGKDTRHAMLLGVRNALRGLVRDTVEQFAEQFGAYPQIIATGGDAAALFAEDDVIEHIVPELHLLGIAEACVVEREEG